MENEEKLYNLLEQFYRDEAEIATAVKCLVDSGVKVSIETEIREDTLIWKVIFRKLNAHNEKVYIEKTVVRNMSRLRKAVVEAYSEAKKNHWQIEK